MSEQELKPRKVIVIESCEDCPHNGGCTAWKKLSSRQRVALFISNSVPADFMLKGCHLDDAPSADTELQAQQIKELKEIRQLAYNLISDNDFDEEQHLADELLMLINPDARNIRLIKQERESAIEGLQAHNRMLAEALETLIKKYWKNQHCEKGQFISCVTPTVIPDYWVNAKQALSNPNIAIYKAEQEVIESVKEWQYAKYNSDILGRIATAATHLKQAQE